MKKRILTISLILILCLTAVLPVYANESADTLRVVDGADLLDDSQESALLNKLDTISEKHQTDVVVVTVKSTGSATPMEYADDYFDYNGYGKGENRDGVLLLISMQERDWWISTSGLCIDAMTDSDIESIGDLMSTYLSDGNYADAFNIFADECDYYINGHINGYPFDAGASLVAALVIGLIVAFISTMVMKSSLKSVKPQPAAANYLKNGSLNITNSREIFLYKHIDRRLKPKDNSSSSTHTSSSGRTHGGGGGKF